ncbi:MAG TPA: IS200/IS605 family accessory protein TnpB-related protein [Rhabdochlamydiaceae bacterium]|nr:IS200/IS605 family accessory protein TnpB-related protein [Rhabdochlamydiaceae bacterium]
MSDDIRTYQTRVPLDLLAQKILQASAELFSQITHSLFADISSGKKPSDLKSSYLKKYGITARQFNACRVNIQGKISSIKERRKQLILEQKERIQKLEKKLPKIKDPLIKHQKKRRLHFLKQNNKRLVQESKKNKVPLCFGSKKLFRAQFNLEKNGYQKHEEWLADWKNARSNEFLVLGSKDETSGNQSCTATIESDNTLTLRLRLPNALIPQFGKYLTIPNVRFSYGQDQILSALKASEKQALTYRFKYDKKSWRVFVSTALPKTAYKSRQHIGVIGVDININHLALVETDRFGNPILKKTIPLNLYGKTQDQARALIGDVSAEVIQYAEQSSKPVILEDLDFQRKKNSLRENSSSKARQLSSFSYQSIITHLKSRGRSQQIEVWQVNPAFTSVIGRIKYAHRYGLSIHHSAALCIGRRFLSLSEKVPRHLGKIPDGKNSHVALSAPVRKQNSTYGLWGNLSRKLKVALAAHFRTQRSLSIPKKSLVIEALPDLVGAIPTHESSAELLG